MEQLPCPDGFLLDARDPLRAAHEQINVWLVEMEEAEARRQNHPLQLDSRALKKSFRPKQLAELLDAVLVRAAWLAGETGKTPAHSGHASRVQSMLLALSRLPLPLDDAHIASLIEFAAGRLQYWWPREELGARVEEAFERGVLTEATWRLIHELHAGMAHDNSITGQTVRRKFGVLLWFDPYDATDPKRCWSEDVRRDLRAMPEDRRGSWIRVFRSIPVSDATEPPNAWLKTARSLLPAIGLDDFLRHMLPWFAPFQEARPIPLTMVGSHILKGLLWYCRLIRDPRLDDAALTLLETRWRNKDFVFRPLTVLAGNVALLPADRAWPILVRIQQQLGAKASARFEKVLKQVGAQLGFDEARLRDGGLLEPRPEAPAFDFAALASASILKLNTSVSAPERVQRRNRSRRGSH